MDIDDQVCFGRIQTQFYKLDKLVFTPEPASTHLIDYHMKLILKDDIMLHPGYEVLVKTGCIIGEGIADFCLHIKKSDKIHLTLHPTTSSPFNSLIIYLGNYRFLNIWKNSLVKSSIYP